MSVTATKINYSLWSLPADEWKDPLEGINFSELEVSLDIEDIKKSISDRTKPFDAPVNPDQLNKVIG